MSAGDNEKLLKALGDDGICSIYTAKGSTKTWEQMQKFIAKAKSASPDKKIQFVIHTPKHTCKVWWCSEEDHVFDKRQT